MKSIAKKVTPLTWTDLFELGVMDNARRWFPDSLISEYFRTIRYPSRAWPNSYAKAALTVKFAKWLIENRPEIADKYIIKE
jgi:hypothetical protein